MSTRRAGEATAESAVEGVGVGRATLYGAGVAFWGYLVVRWFHDWVVEPGVGVSRREPFVSSDGVLALAERLGAVGGPAAVAVDPVAGFLEFVGFGLGVLPQLAEGAWATVVLTVVGMLGGLVIAVPVAVARVYGGRLLSALALAYTELIRGTPLLAQLFVLYFGLRLSAEIRQLPFVGTGVVPEEAFFVAAIGFVVNSAAYQAEYFRGAFQSVDEGQLVAARSVGLSQLEGIRFVVVPQALRYGIPAWSNEFVYLVKYSSLAAFITVPELFFRADAIGSKTFAIVEVLTLAGLFYLALVLTVTRLTRRLERAVAIPGVGSDVEPRSA